MTDPKDTPVRRRRAYTESNEQRLFIQRWRLHPLTRHWPACAVPNGGRRGVVEAARLKAEGVSPGVPDWLCFVPGLMPLGTGCVGLALEFKAPGKRARPTPDQLRWHEQLTAQGWRVHVVQSAAEAWETVASCYGHLTWERTL